MGLKVHTNSLMTPRFQKYWGVTTLRFPRYRQVFRLLQMCNLPVSKVPGSHDSPVFKVLASHDKPSHCTYFGNRQIVILFAWKKFALILIFEVLIPNFHRFLTSIWPTIYEYFWSIAHKSSSVQIFLYCKNCSISEVTPGLNFNAINLDLYWSQFVSYWSNIFTDFWQLYGQQTVQISDQ